MHGSSPFPPVVLSGYGGLVTLAKPESVPEGASPRTYDTDFNVGSTGTRAGLTNRYTYAPGTHLGPDPGTVAVDALLGGLSWANPGNVLLNTGVYATASLLGEVGDVGVGSVTITSPGVYDTGATITAAFAGTGSGAAGTVQTATQTVGGFTWKYVTGVTITARGVYTGPITVTFTSSTGGTATGTVVTQDVGPLTDAIDVTGFTFNVPSTSRPQGFLVNVLCYASTSEARLYVQMLKAGVPVGAAAGPYIVNTSPTTLNIGSITDLFGADWLYSDLNNTEFGFRITVTSSTAVTVNVGYSTLEPYLLPSACNFQYVTTFTAQDGSIRNISIDADGNFWYEDLTNNPGILNLVTEGIASNSLVTAINGPDVEYMAFCDGRSGSDMPLQYTKDWIDRITQVGPGAAPIFTPQSASTDTFAISTITQPPAATDPYGNPFYGGIYFLQSSGPGSTSPGNVVTIYYGDSAAGTPANADLVAAFNSGFPTYIYLSVTGTPVTFGPYTQQVTSVGEAQPPGQPRNFFYFTYIVPSVAFTYYQGSGHPGYEVAFQRTLATMTMSVPVPGLTVGNQVSISGASVPAWDNVWTISQTLNSSTMAITQTNVTSGVATYTYALTGGSSVAPTAGQLVTVTGTTNANGALNVTNATIVSATGGSSGSFTLNVSAPDASTVAESGLATTAGTQFAFDPGVPVVGTGTSPIYGNSTGGTLTWGGASGQFISPGTRQGTVIFITRNGYYTAPAPPVTFTCPENTTNIVANQIPIGPPNVVARAILLTEAGQNGVPGANFFTLPTPVQYIVNNVTYTANALFINDNVTTTQAFFFTDSVLLNGLAVDVYGYNLFNQIEIGDPGWVVNYADRNFYGLCRNKVQNFNNLSFDGGYLPATRLTPLGWTQPDAFGSLVVSAKFGDAYYIANNGLTLGIIATQMTSGTATYSYTASSNDPAPGDPITVTGTTNGGGVFNVTGATIATVDPIANTFTVTGLSGTYSSQPEAGVGTVTGTLPQAGLITQTAYQDAYQQPIIQPNTLYSVRVSAAIPSGLTTGNLVISLTSAGNVLGSFTLPFSEMTTNYQTYIGTLLTTKLPTVPSDITLNVYASNLGPGADLEIDRIEPYPTAIPILTTSVYGSYAGLPEQVDAVTGLVVFSSENQQPVNGAMVLYDTFYGLKGWTGTNPGSSLYSLQKQSNLEPAQWDEPEVAQRSGGSCGPLAFDLGEQWFLGASRAGLYLFVGGQPGKISQEIYQVWDAINWKAAETIWVKVDITQRRLYVGVPLPTPNFWLPNAPVNANPTSPNVILMCNYQGIDSGQELKSEPQMHTTMFGTLNAIDMRRKWSIWQIPAPYANFCAGVNDQELQICNGRGNSKIYTLDSTNETDDGVTIDSLYTTAGLVELSKRQQAQGVGGYRIRWGHMTAALESSGNILTTLYPNRLLGPGDPTTGYNSWQVPGGITPGKPAYNDAEVDLNFAATRTFIEFREMDGHGFTLSNLALEGHADPWNALRGRTGV
jgi:hypothetical protein